MALNTDLRTLGLGALGGTLALGLLLLLAFQTGLLSLPTETSTTLNKPQARSVLVGATAPESFRLAAERSTPGVVYISTREEQAPTLWDLYAGRRSRVQEGTGSGVIYTRDGYVVTNNHVIAGAQEIEVSLTDDRRFAAQLVGTYPPADLAVLKIEAAQLPSLTFADSDAAQVGDWVLAVGNPYNLSSTVTAGIVSARGRDVNIIDARNAIESFIQTDAAINPGNSGGALVNASGDVVGINTAIYSRSGAYSGYGFAIPSNLVRRIVDDIIETGAFRQIVLGLDAVQLDEEYATALGLSTTQGILIEEVLPAGIAAEAGLQAGDIIVGAKGQRIRAISEFRAAVSSTPRGGALDIEIIRDRRTRIVELSL